MLPRCLRAAAFVVPLMLLACGKKETDVEGVWEVDIEASTDSIAKDPADLDLDPRIQRIKGLTRTGLVPPGDRGEIVQARRTEVRALLTEMKTELDFRRDGKVALSSMKDGARETKDPYDWKVVDGKVVVGGGNTFTFEGKLLKGRLLDGHPGQALLRRR